LAQKSQSCNSSLQKAKTSILSSTFSLGCAYQDQSSSHQNSCRSILSVNSRAGCQIPHLVLHCSPWPN
jgi:hypothetical protein